MKKIVFMVAMMLLSINAMAQEADKQGKGEFKPMDRTEMVQKRTEATVKKYGLNEEQAAKLLQLNNKYADQMGPMGGGPRMGRRGGMPPRMANDSLREQRQRRMISTDSLKADRQSRPDRRGGFNPEAGRKAFEAYDTELKAILTPEQYEAYKADQKKQFEGRMNGPRGNRPHRDNQNK